MILFLVLVVGLVEKWIKRSMPLKRNISGLEFEVEISEEKSGSAGRNIHRSAQTGGSLIS